MCSGRARRRSRAHCRGLWVHTRVCMFCILIFLYVFVFVCIFAFLFCFLLSVACVFIIIIIIIMRAFFTNIYLSDEEGCVWIGTSKTPRLAVEARQDPTHAALESTAKPEPHHNVREFHPGPQPNTYSSSLTHLPSLLSITTHSYPPAHPNTLPRPNSPKSTTRALTSKVGVNPKP